MSLEGTSVTIDGQIISEPFAVISVHARNAFTSDLSGKEGRAYIQGRNFGKLVTTHCEENIAYTTQKRTKHVDKGIIADLDDFFISLRDTFNMFSQFNQAELVLTLAELPDIPRLPLHFGGLLFKALSTQYSNDIQSGHAYFLGFLHAIRGEPPLSVTQGTDDALDVDTAPHSFIQASIADITDLRTSFTNSIRETAVRIEDPQMRARFSKLGKFADKFLVNFEEEHATRVFNVFHNFALHELAEGAFSAASTQHPTRLAMLQYMPHYITLTSEFAAHIAEGGKKFHVHSLPGKRSKSNFFIY